MTWIDTHAHLTDSRLAAQIGEVLSRAIAAGVERVVCVATSADDSVACRALARQFPAVVAPAVGIHPNHAAEAQPGDWERIEQLANHADVAAIGETGLDRHWDFAPFEMQEDYFDRHLALARRTHRPIVIHCREAESEVLKHLRAGFERNGPISGVLHSFCGTIATAAAAIEMGLHISFAGMLTYKKADNVREVVPTVPMDRLLVETDCPYLAPEPMRGKTNEPAFVVHTGHFLARLLNLEPNRLASLTTANAQKLFFQRN